jgi:hypothetical protein
MASDMMRVVLHARLLDILVHLTHYFKGRPVLWLRRLVVVFVVVQGL